MTAENNNSGSGYRRVGAGIENPNDTRGPSMPWHRWLKTPEGRIDNEQPPLMFRFIEGLNDFYFVLSHWDDDLKKKVACGRKVILFKKTNQEGLSATDDCEYCKRNREAKAEFQRLKDMDDPSVAKMSYAKVPCKLDVCLVCQVSALVHVDGRTTQEFRLLALKATDRVFTTGKGAYKYLNTFEDVQKKKKKPSNLQDYWFSYSVARMLEKDELVEKIERINPDGINDENGDRIDSLNAMPFPYFKAIQMREKLAEQGNNATSYDAPAEQPKAKVDKVEPVAADEEDDDSIPPF